MNAKMDSRARNDADADADVAAVQNSRLTPLQILSLRINTAAGSGNLGDKIQEFLPDDATPGDKFQFFTALYDEVRREINVLLRSHSFSGELKTYLGLVHNLIGKLGDLIVAAYGTDLLNSGVDQEVSAESVNKLYLDWILLGIEELGYLCTQEVWTDDHLELTNHVHLLLSQIYKSVSKTPMVGVQSVFVDQLCTACDAALKSDALRQILVNPPLIEAGCATYALFSIAALCDNNSVREQVADLVPLIFKQLQRIAPQDYCAEDVYCEGDFNAAESCEFDGIGNRYESMIEISPAERQLIVRNWSAAFKSGLETICRLPPSEDRGEQLFQIVDASPMEMPELPVVLDALVCASKAQLKRVVGYLVEVGKNDGRAILCLLGIADFIGRKDIQGGNLDFDPLDLIEETLGQIEESIRILILDGCKCLLNSRPDYFDNYQLTSSIIEDLLDRFSSRDD